jgi:hypothetical protein
LRSSFHFWLKRNDAGRFRTQFSHGDDEIDWVAFAGRWRGQSNGVSVLGKFSERQYGGREWVCWAWPTTLPRPDGPVRNRLDLRLRCRLFELNIASVRAILCDMQAIGYVRVSTDRHAELGVSLEAQEAKIRAMATVQEADLIDVIVDGGESAKSLNGPGLQRLLAVVNAGKLRDSSTGGTDRTRHVLCEPQSQDDRTPTL